MTAPVLLRGVDLAAFAVALVDRLRAGGVTVSAVGPATLVQAMRELAPADRARLYWTARLSLVTRVEDLPAFDAVFEAVFADAVIGLDPPGLKRSALASTVPSGTTTTAGPVSTGDLPWTTRPAVVSGATGTPDGAFLPDLAPSWLAGRTDEPFDRFDADELRQLGVWLENAQARWPHRRSLRRRRHPAGRRVDLRETIRASRTTGWEPLQVARTRARTDPRRVVLVCDVSGSMQPYAAVYLHLMRATALRRTGRRPEVFAFATRLTRLTAVLAHRSAELALARANEKVDDRYGGTRLAGSIGALLGGPHGHALRGAVVLIASDGWDSDPPELLRRVMVRLRRRAHLVVWLNPRAAAPGYVPLAGSMAAALPLCDQFLPAHTLTGLRAVFETIAGD
ncbi:VWA domain-containing protein [Mycobacterium sp. TNTM28]|uniref:VWA domain-containing protein n=1 Tax=[Mycobacterium] fortunisiensis TaxID=2600579 RepID=A0ABS6KGS3_9MYCO|nr:VWA domain-containing protein [[Mycobacterium] fortunisiensis]MBU9762754.1 VWA domain-containing protein [[Mycobacterium] fortunisiensis]